MKILKLIFSAVAVVTLVTLSGCGEEPSLSAVEQTLTKMMAKTWTVQNVNISGVDATQSYATMTLKFTETAYTATNGGVVWPASGTWQFTDVTATKVNRNDGLEVTIVEASEAVLKLSFTWTKTTFGGGRSQSVAGVHVFTFR